MRVPLRVGREVVAVVVTGQVLDHRPTEKGFKSMWRRLRDLDMPKGKLREAYLATPFVTKRYLHAVLSLLQLVAQLVVDTELRLRELHRDSAASVIEEAERFMEKEYAMPLRLHDIASYVHLSPVHLRRLYKKKTGVNLFDFLTKVRIGQANEVRRKYGQREVHFATRRNL